MLDRVIPTLVQSQNEAADAVLLEALRVGAPREQASALDALLSRQTDHGLAGVVAQFDALASDLQSHVLEQVKLFHHALRECGRSPDAAQRLAALHVIMLGRQGRLAYVLSENLHDSNEQFSNAAADAMVGLARWAATATRELQKGSGFGVQGSGEEQSGDLSSSSPEPRTLNPAFDPENQIRREPSFSPDTYATPCDQRPDIEEAIARAMDVHRGRHGQDLPSRRPHVCDWAGSTTLAILSRTKHGGQSPMVRELQRAPSAAGGAEERRGNHAIAKAAIESGMMP